MYQNILFLLSYMYQYWRILLNRLYTKKQLSSPPVDPIAEFVEKQSTTLQCRCKNKTLANQNTDMVFYSKKGYQQMLVDEKNRYEKMWKTRFLLTMTPRGNIIMYYDVYKLGFAYYSDTQSIPYSVLNATAMKYVSQFQCLDLFMDDRSFPEFHISPLIPILLAEDKKTTENKDEKSKKFIPNNAPFAKLKNYSKSTAYANTTDLSGSLVEKEDTPPKEYTSNRFICLGKIVNFKLLQPPPLKKAVIKEYTSKLFDDFRGVHPIEYTIHESASTGDTPAEKKEMNYRAYKELRNRTILLHP